MDKEHQISRRDATREGQKSRQHFFKGFFLRVDAGRCGMTTSRCGLVRDAVFDGKTDFQNMGYKAHAGAKWRKWEEISPARFDAPSELHSVTNNFNGPDAWGL